MQKQLIRVLAGGILAVSLAVPVLAKCAIYPLQETASPNGKLKLVPGADGSFTFQTLDAAGKRFQITGRGKFAPFGHHLRAQIPDAGGRFVLHDPYAGVAVYAADGKLVRMLKPEDLLTATELKDRPGSFACHKEGQWADEAMTLSLNGETAVATVHTGRKVRIDLATGKVTQSQVRRPTEDAVRTAG